ncbi:MAG: type I-U CRISPR-associated RAMP protein Csb1/Cas7u [Pseudomonadota bacterium]
MDLRSLELVKGPYAALRINQRLLPAGGPGSKLFPPTFEGGVYCFEQRRIDGETKHCVLLHSVAACANLHEEVLLDLAERGEIELPRMLVDFDAFPEIGHVSTLEASHRVFDAVFRDSELEGQPFSKHPLYKELSRSNAHNATALFAHSPHALLFGCWDSTGSAGGLGNKFARRLVSEIIGVGVERGETRGGVKQDQLGISRNVEIEIDKNGDWKPKGVLTGEKAERAKGTRPAEVNHGSILVGVDVEYVDEEIGGQYVRRRVPLRGGVTCDYALQTSVISLAGLRRLRFPIGANATPEQDDAARAVLCAMGLLAVAASRERGYALRSRCDLVPDGIAPVEVVHCDGSVQSFSLDGAGAIALYREAVEAAKKAGLPWRAEPLRLKPQAKLVKLIELSRVAAQGGE